MPVALVKDQHHDSVAEDSDGNMLPNLKETRREGYLFAMLILFILILFYFYFLFFLFLSIYLFVDSDHDVILNNYCYCFESWSEMKYCQA